MKIKYIGYQPTKTDVNIDYDDMALPRGGSDVYRLAPKMPSNSPMPKCKPPKGYWEIPSFMSKEKQNEKADNS